MAKRPRRPPPIEPKIRTFFGAEGKGEKSLAQWLEGLRNVGDRRHHHGVWNLEGGDTLSLVNKALRKRKDKDLPGQNRFVKSFLLLDSDRYEQDGERRQEAIRAAQTGKLILIWQRPNIEGLLLRLFPNCETLDPPATATRGELEKKWLGYDKSFSRQNLEDNFKIEDLTRAARFDEHLQRLLKELDLIG